MLRRFGLAGDSALLRLATRLLAHPISLCISLALATLLLLACCAWSGLRLGLGVGLGLGLGLGLWLGVGLGLGIGLALGLGLGCACVGGTMCRAWRRRREIARARPREIARQIEDAKRE